VEPQVSGRVSKHVPDGMCKCSSTGKDDAYRERGLVKGKVMRGEVILRLPAAPRGSGDLVINQSDGFILSEEKSQGFSTPVKSWNNVNDVKIKTQLTFSLVLLCVLWVSHGCYVTLCGSSCFSSFFHPQRHSLSFDFLPLRNCSVG